jgi:hypothetical protein
MTSIMRTNPLGGAQRIALPPRRVFADAIFDMIS